MPDDLTPHRPTPPARPPLGARILGVVLLLSSVWLVSCQALFTW
ncbi:hypothetical protein [uncultured Thiocystis sp.]|nr:hypothetical protein [uncultured Thiocystis sp.]